MTDHTKPDTYWIKIKRPTTWRECRRCRNAAKQMALPRTLQDAQAQSAVLSQQHAAHTEKP